MSEKSSKSSNEITKKTSDCPITQVTVYKDRAEICRELELSLLAGVNELHVQEFVIIDEDSLRVEGKGNATIAEVSFQRKYVSQEDATSSEKVKKLQDELKNLQKERKQLDFNNKLNTLNKRWNVLDNFAASAARHGEGSRTEDKSGFKLDDVYFKEMQDFLKHYDVVAQQINAERVELERKNEELAEKISTAEANLREAQGGIIPGFENREVVVLLEAEKETKVQLTISYVVHGASWSPLYDIRMFTDKGVMKIVYYGLIRQSSEEDWTDVRLFLSTAEPSIGGTVPTLPATQLSFKKYVPPSPPPAAHARMRQAKMSRSIEPEMEQCNVRAMSYSMASDMVIPELAYSPVQVSESTTSTTYEIARLSTIPSDFTEHKVTVALIELTPNLTYLTVPKVVPHAFLTAKVANTSQFTLLPGRTNIFLDNSFVAKADIKAVAPKEEFECSLGVDTGIRVNYKPLVKVNSSSGLISKTQCINHEQAIEVKNMHDYNVKVVVRDNLPKSLDEKIKVNLVSPQIDAKHPEKSGVKLVKNTVEWELDVKGLDKTEVLLKYTVEYPASEELQTNTIFEN